jgi:phosphoglycerate kinase
MQNMNNYNFAGKKALIRVDFNVPLDEQKNVTDNTRIKAAIPTIKKVLENGGSAILMSHLGRPKGKVNPDMSLKFVVKSLSDLLPGKEIKFASDCVGSDAKEKAKSLKPGEVLLLENLRYHNEEEAGDKEFSKELAGLGDVYINDAFGTAHRAHASTTIIADYFPENKMFGYLMEDEVQHIDKVLKSHEKPFTAIIGGAKVSDKVGIIENLMEKADNILIGGAMAYTFLKAKGGNVGKSKTEDDKLDLARMLIEKAKAKGVKLLLPKDSLTAETFSNDAPSIVENSDQISNDRMGLDIGPEAIKEYKEVLMNSKTILWNGPMGVFEWSNYENGTKEIAFATADATSKGAFSLIGGGDSVAAINKFGLDKKVSYVSTGGGAMLEYLEGKELPGIEAIRKN